MSEFPHLPLPKKISAPYRHRGAPIERTVAETTLLNLENRSGHGRNLKRATNSLQTQWNQKLAERQEEGLPDLPSGDVPIFMRVDTDLFDADSLYSLGIEVIAEDEKGYIIGAAGDNFKSLKDKIDKFIATEGKYKNKAAQLWEIVVGDQWRVEHILSTELSAKWDQIDDDADFTVDVSIACSIKIPTAPAPGTDESAREYKERYQAWVERKEKLERKRDDLEVERQVDFGNFIDGLEGVIISDFVGYSDSFCCRVELTGKALKDLVLTYQYVFDVTEYDSFRYTSSSTDEDQAITSSINAPELDSPKVCVIDSGIQEGHRLLNAAIHAASSKSYIPGDPSVADAVSNGGHGTKVAGAILYGNNIPKSGVHSLDMWICNARVLNARNELPRQLFPPQLMEEIVHDFVECRVFNLSINASRSCKLIHMSQWAATIDKLSGAKDVLFIVSSGNISISTGNVRNPGIREHFASRRSYPEYLLTSSARIADPSQSCFALTVGSVCHDNFEDLDRKSFGVKDEPSSFTRTGPGIWRMIKPDVVELGGDFLREKGANPNISQWPSISSEVVRTTTGGSNAIGFDVGTSYAAPKVTHIAGKILNQIPDASANLLRALIVQSARLPEEKFRNPQFKDLQFYGYGIPDVSRATENSERRITMIEEGKISAKEAQIFTVKIPDEIRRAGNEYDILVEVTLAFSATPRRTRRRTNSYLSTWVDWQSSKYEESYTQFKNRVTKYVAGSNVEDIAEESDSDEHIKWNIRENINWGTVRNLRRQDSSLQKDWTILKAYSLPEEFSIAVVGHKGWEKDTNKKVPFSIAVTFEVLNAEVDIYNLVRIENEIEIEVQTS